MNLGELTYAKGAQKKRKRVGRGSASGWGKTAGKGHKGQKARSGGSIRIGFEGGQMPLHRRLPKRGFKNVNHIEYSVVNLSDLEATFSDGAIVDIAAMVEKGLIRRNAKYVKVLGAGKLTKKLEVKAHAFSETALNEINSKGGKAEVI